MTISTLLVANRGEIALRIIRAARTLGLRTVAVYSDADAGAPHVAAADVAVRIGPAAAASSYLDIDALLGAAERTGADAVHPGYGFLSERAAFARAVTEAGLTFVGPGADVIELMGRKDAAREVAVAAGVPVVPQVRLPTRSSDPQVGPRDSVAAVDPAHFPVLVKAAAGGGGKGMRIVRHPADLDAALAGAQREALAAFGDGTVLVERFVEGGRHVEVQVLADHHGGLVHLFERDCSAQRRHQKVIEEAPAPGLSAEVRAVLRASALALAKRVGYTNAGTVEFLVRGEEAYFLEMNTRLQVEHPVTEAVTGVDIVALQLRIAAGERLPFTQADLAVTGHAIEARIYAEDAFNGFLPQAGTAELVRWPAEARVDAALASGDVVGTAYDPMLGKIIAHGATRETARRALVAALDDTAILGLVTNVGFVRALAASATFRDGDVDTGWLDAHPGAIRPPDPQAAVLLAAWAVATQASSPVVAAGAPAGPQDVRHPFGCADGWRLTGPSAPTLVDLVVDGEPRTYRVARGAGTGGDATTGDGMGGDATQGDATAGDATVGEASVGWVTVGDRMVAVRRLAGDPGVLRLDVAGNELRGIVGLHPDHVEVSHLGHTVRFGRPAGRRTRGAAATTDGTVLAPMPGTVLAVHVATGDPVEAGAALGVMEAMKMEVTLTSPIAGTVTEVGTAAGDRVALGATLFVVCEPTA